MAEDFKNEEEAIRYIRNVHKKESNHRGFNENFEYLKNKVYYPKLKILIQKYINNCSICQEAKYDRSPLKIKYKLTNTPSDQNEIVGLDTWTMKGQRFLTSIDRFSKHAMILHLTDRNLITIREALRNRHASLGKPKLYIADNEFDGLIIKDFFREEGIELHLTKPNSHTGNSDIERLHNTLNEQIRVMEINPDFKELDMKSKCFKAAEFYNNSVHSVTKEKPINFIIGNIKTNKSKIKERIEIEKKRRIEKLNKGRQSDPIREEEQVLIKNYKSLRHKQEPKYKLHKNQNLHPSNIKRKYKYIPDVSHNNIPPTLVDANKRRGGNTN